MRFQRAIRDEPSINLTPLIDILFLVLMFLVLTATFRGTFALDLALPAAGTAVETLVEAPGTIRIVMTADGLILLDDEQPVPIDDLGPRLSARPADARRRVILSADARRPHGDVVAVIDQVRRAGIFMLRIEATPLPSLTALPEDSR